MNEKSQEGRSSWLINSYSALENTRPGVHFLCLSIGCSPLDPFILTDKWGESKGYFVMSTTLNNPVTYAYDPSRDKGYYAKVSIAFWRDPRYSILIKGVYTYLLTYATQFELVFPSQASICKELHISEKTLRKVIKNLIRAGLLTVKRRGQGKANLYKIYFIPLINNYGDKGEQKNTASRSRAARRLEESESKNNKNDSIGFNNKNNPTHTPVDFSKLLPGGKYYGSNVVISR